MKFKKVFRGYDPKEVDKHLTETANKEQQIRREQKERIDELVDENTTLRKLVAQYQANEQAISKSLIEAHNVAEEVKLDADRYSELVLARAKIFCATWRAYSATLVATLSEEEVLQFNFLQRKIEGLISNFNDFSNPISRIEGAAEQEIDLKELLSPKQSLEEICAELGLARSQSK